MGWSQTRASLALLCVWITQGSRHNADYGAAGPQTTLSSKERDLAISDICASSARRSEPRVEFILLMWERSTPHSKGAADVPAAVFIPVPWCVTGGGGQRLHTGSCPEV